MYCAARYLCSGILAAATPTVLCCAAEPPCNVVRLSGTQECALLGSNAEAAARGRRAFTHLSPSPSLPSLVPSSPLLLNRLSSTTCPGTARGSSSRTRLATAARSSAQTWSSTRADAHGALSPARELLPANACTAGDSSSALCCAWGAQASLPPAHSSLLSTSAPSSPQRLWHRALPGQGGG